MYYGPEFAGKVLDAWAYEAGVTLSFIRPGKPVENAYIESFNGRFRDECLNEHWFVSMRHAKRLIEEWRIEYNTERPHSSLNLSAFLWVRRLNNTGYPRACINRSPNRIAN